MVRGVFRFVISAGAVVLVAGAVATAQSRHNANGGLSGGHPHGGAHQVYQRQAFDWRDKRRDWRDKANRRPFTPQSSGAWFQRPYPYHLDYYKMRWGGSYAPYFGNLYGVPFGTPQVVNGEGGYGGWGTNGSVPPQGYEWLDGAAYPTGAAVEQLQAEESTDRSTPQQPTEKNESLPSPAKPN